MLEGLTVEEDPSAAVISHTLPATLPRPGSQAQVDALPAHTGHCDAGMEPQMKDSRCSLHGMCENELGCGSTDVSISCV